jgi:hypothetical protein
LDEIAKEKQRLGEALMRIDAQREKLTGELGELEAAERVLARYSKGAETRRPAAAKVPPAATKSATTPRLGGRSRTATARGAGSKRSSSSLSDQVLALATGKTQPEITAACEGARPNHVGAVIARAQAGWTHRGAGWQALCAAVCED